MESCYGQSWILRGRVRTSESGSGSARTVMETGFKGSEGRRNTLLGCRLQALWLWVLNRHTVICEVSAAAKASCILRWTSSIWHWRILCTNKCHRRSVTPRGGHTPHPTPTGGEGGPPDEISFAGWTSRSPAGSLVRRLRVFKVYNCMHTRLGKSRSPAQTKSLPFKAQA